MIIAATRYSAESKLALPIRQQFVLLIPCLLMVFGPPLWRSFLSRGLGASAAGKLDVGVLLQLMTYALVAGMMLFQWFRWRHVQLVSRDALAGLMVLALVPLAMYLSVVNAPSFLLTFVMATLFAIGWFAALQLAVFIGGGRIQLHVAIQAFLLVNGALLALILLSDMVLPRTVNVFSQGAWRVKGNGVGELFLCSVTTMLGGIFLYLFRGQRFVPLLLLAVGAYGLFLPQLRIGYVAILLAVIAVLMYELKLQQQPVFLGRGTVGKRSLIPLAVLLVPILVFLATAVFSQDIVQSFTRGRDESVTTLSGRTYVWEWIEERAKWWFGHGFVSGFRADFQNMDVGMAHQFSLNRVNIRLFGSAHSSFYELVYGVGWVAAIGISALLVWVMVLSAVRNFLIDSPSSTHRAQGFVFAIALSILVPSLTLSACIMPPGHQFGTMMFAFALSLGSTYARRRGADSL